MAIKLTVEEIRALGFEWPKFALIEKYSIVEEGRIDLTRTLAKLQTSRAYYKGQLNEAFNFKMRTGADYSDFTDKHDDNAWMNYELGSAIAYLEKIVNAANQG